ncbi:hypothetical protein TNCV_3109821 [Trichonephila clavipes]|nr:hypothetical protein TNCV_3109821 [Trichonephila clavipes]
MPADVSVIHCSHDPWVATTNLPNSYTYGLEDSRGNRVIKVTCHEFESSTTKDPPCRAAMHVKSVESSNVLPFVLCGGSWERWCQFRCRPRHLTMIQTTWSVAKNPRVAEHSDVNIHSLTRCLISDATPERIFKHGIRT